VSSTRIRQALAEHDLELAHRLLGRSYSVCGRVFEGDKRGRQLGFPTANIYLGKRILPLSGVYAVKVHGLASKVIYGVANAGTRPTVDGQRRSLEVHLFDFDQEIYGRYIEIEFVQYVRSEMRFDGLQSLQEQIAKDVEQAKEILLK
jgi:riboflavin kinase/FMN adenylyltransferase